MSHDNEARRPRTARASRGMGARVHKRPGRPTADVSNAGFSVRKLGAACLVYAVATIVLSYPLAFHPRSLSRLDNGDARLNAWAISWVAHQLVRDPLELFEANTFHPLPLSLAYSEHLTLLGALAIPVLAVTDDLVLTNNVLLLVSMFASALGMYLLAYSLTKSHLASLLAGLFFSFAPFRFNRLPHIQMQLYAFIPLFLAGLHLYLDSRRVRWLVLASGAFVLQALAGTYLGAIASVALGMALVTLVPTARLSARELGRIVLALGLAAVVLVPFALPYFWVHENLGVEWDLGGLGSLSATPTAYASSSTHFYRAASEAMTSDAARTDYLFPGLTLIVFGGLGLVLLLKDRETRAIGICYTAILVAGVILSLGPATPVHPFLYEHVVFFRGLRALTRFGLLPLLSLSVFAAHGLAWLVRGLERRRLAVGAIAVFFVAESTGLPYPLTTHRDDPPPVYRWLATQKPGPIVELPFKVVDTRYMFWARHHGFRPMLNGDSGFIPMSHQWMKIALGRFPSNDAVALLRRLEVRYVVLHLGGFRAPALPRVLNGLREHRDALLPIRDFGSQVVYEVLPANDPSATAVPANDSSATAVPAPTWTKLESTGSAPRLFDGAVDAAPPGDDPVLEVELELTDIQRIEAFRFHYGPVPRTPVESFAVVAEDAGGARFEIDVSDWPAVTALVAGLLETPLNGTQLAPIEPIAARTVRLHLRGIDGKRPDVTEIEVLGRAQSSRENTGN